MVYNPENVGFLYTVVSIPFDVLVIKTSKKGSFLSFSSSLVNKLLLPISFIVTSCCCLYHLCADDETSNVLKRSVKNVRTRFGSLLYINVTALFC